MLQTLDLVLGADARFDIPLRVDGEAPSGGIAGYGLAFLLFADRTDPDTAALLTLTSAAGAITIFDAAAGIARLLITKEQLSALAPGKYFWRVTSLAPNGDDDVPAHGWAIVSR